MIFFGLKSKTLKKGVLSNVLCNYCEEESNMEYDIIQKYFHLYFIPFIPLKKEDTICCSNCGGVYVNKNIPKSLSVKLERIKENNVIKTPIWAFSGLIILTLLICWAPYQSSKYDEKEDDYILNPKKGDVYFLNYKPGHYTTLRIDKVDSQQVYFTLNDTATSKYTKIFGILSETYYTNKKGTYTRQQIKDLFKKDSIISITRK